MQRRDAWRQLAGAARSAQRSTMQYDQDGRRARGEELLALAIQSPDMANDMGWYDEQWRDIRTPLER